MAVMAVGYSVGAIAVALGISRSWIPDDVELYAWWAFNVVGWPFYAITTTVWALGWLAVLARRWSDRYSQTT